MGLANACLIPFPAVPLEETSASYKVGIYTKEGTVQTRHELDDWSLDK